MKVPGPLILLGGDGQGARRRRPNLLLQAVVEMAGVPRPAVAYVGAASGDDPDYFAWTATALHDAGAGTVTLAPTTGHALHRDAVRTQLAAADLVYMSGGDVEDGMRVLTAAGLAAFLRDLHAAGKPFAAVSAGSILLGREWVRWTDPDDESTAARFPCLGIAPLVCDTHAEDDDWEELRRLLELQGDGAAGCGIPSGGALRVAPDGAVSALLRPLTRLANRRARIRRLPDLAPA